jgi:hypothetical protein
VRIPAVGMPTPTACGATGGEVKSSPEQNPRPAPVRMTTRQVASAATSSRSSCSVVSNETSSALRRSGRLRVSTVSASLGRSTSSGAMVSFACGRWHSGRYPPVVHRKNTTFFYQDVLAITSR